MLRRRLACAVLTLAAAVVPACSGGDAGRVDAAMCTDLADVTDPETPATTSQRTEALQRLGEALPSSTFGELGALHLELERGFESAVTEPAAFEVGLRFAVAMHDHSDEAPVPADVADAVRATCPRIDTRLLRGGPDAFQAEPDETVGPVTAGSVDTFVASLAEAHRETGGTGCGVLAEALGFDPGGAVAHLNADSWSGEIGCAFLDDSGELGLAVVAVDGRVHPGLQSLTARPGQPGDVRTLFGLDEGVGVAAFDADSDGWLVAVAPPGGDPAAALRDLVATLG